MKLRFSLGKAFRVIMVLVLFTIISDLGYGQSISAGSDLVICQSNTNAVITPTLNNLPSNVNIDWYVMGTSTPLSSNTSQNGDFTIPTSTLGTTYYVVEATKNNANPPINEKDTVKVTIVSSAVTPTFTPISPVCYGGSINLPATSLEGFSGIWTPAINNQTTTTYTFTPTAGQCVTGSAVTMTVTITPKTTPTFTQVTPVCKGASFTLPTTSNNGVNGSWSPAINNQNTTTYTFTPSSGQCANSASMTVTVNNPTTPTFSQVAPICKGGSFTLPTTSNNGVNGSWSPALNYQATTTYTFTPTAGQCVSSTLTTMQVQVRDTPVANFNPITNGGCPSKKEVKFNNNSTGNGLSYNWNFGDPGGNNTSNDYEPKHKFSQINTPYTVTLTVTDNNGCTSTKTQVVSIGSVPDATLIDALNFPEWKVCSSSNYSVTVSDASTTGSINTQYVIKWGDGTIYTSATPPVLQPHSYPSTGFFYINYVVYSGTCKDSTEYEVYIGSNPSVSISSPGSTTYLCLPQTITFKIDTLVTRNNPLGTTYQVTFNDGSPDTIFSHPPPPFFTHTFINSSCGATPATKANAFEVNIYATNPCGTTPAYCGGITTVLLPEANFAVTPDTVVCVNSNVTFTNTSLNGNVVVTNGSGSGVFYTCDNTSSLFWNIAAITGVPNSWNIVSGNLGTFSTNSGTSPLVLSFSQPGTYKIMLIVRNNAASPAACRQDTTFKIICVQPHPIPSFTATPKTGCVNLDVNFTNTSTDLPTCGTYLRSWRVRKISSDCNTPSSYAYIAPTDSTSDNPSIRFSQEGQYEIKLFLKTVCGWDSSRPDTIKVKDVPLNVSITPSATTICAGGSLTATSIFCAAGGTMSGFNWGFPGGTPSTYVSTNPSAPNPGTITYSSAGTYTIYDTVKNECGVTPVSATVVVRPLPTAAISITGATTICGGNTSSLQITGTPNTTVTYTINNGTAQTVNLGVTGTYTINTGALNTSTTYTLTTIAYSAAPTCSQPITQSASGIVTVNPLPTVTVNSPTTCAGIPTTVTASPGITGTYSYTWTVPTGVTNPGNVGSFSTTTAGTYSVVITNTLTNCVSSSASGTVTVNPLPTVTVNSPATCAGIPTTVTASPGTTGTYSYTWTVPTGVTNPGNVGSFSTTTAGTYNVVITNTLTNCVSSSASGTVTVKPNPVIDSLKIGAQPNNCTVGTGSILVYGLNPGTAYTLTYNSTSISIAAPSSANPYTISGLTSGTYVITDTLNGCGSLPDTITLSAPNSTPKPTASNDTIICLNQSFNLYVVNPDNQYTYTWYGPANTVVSNTTTYSVANSQVPRDSGWYAVTATKNNCVSARALVHVTINPLPPKPGVRDTAYCQSTTAVPVIAIPLTATAASGDTLNWYSPLNTQLPGAPTPTITTVGVFPFYVSQTITATGCVGPKDTIRVTVNPTPVLRDTTASICSRDSFDIKPTFTPSNTKYTWSAPVINPFGSIVDASNNAPQAQNTAQVNVGQKLINLTSSVATATYTVTPVTTTSTSICTGGTFKVTVTVNPIAKINDTLISVCSNVSFSVTPSSSVAGNIIPLGTTYNWPAAPTVTGGITGGSTGTAQTSITGQLTNPTDTIQTAVYKIIPKTPASPLNCAGDTFRLTVKVSPKPFMHDTAVTICSDDTFNFKPITKALYNIIPRGTIYTWTISSVGANVTGYTTSTTPKNEIRDSLHNSGNTKDSIVYSIIPRAGIGDSCSGLPFNLKVYVNPRPKIDTIRRTICSDSSFNITPTNGGGNIVPAGTIYSWGAPSQSTVGGVTITGGATGNTQLSISSTGLVNNTDSVQILTYRVKPSNPSILGSCSGDSFTIVITVNPKPTIAAISKTICSDSSFNIVPSIGGGNIIPQGTTYSWSTPVITPSSTGVTIVSGSTGTNAASISSDTLKNTTNVTQTVTYTVTPRASIGSCPGRSFNVIITVNPKPKINDRVDTVCSNTAFTYQPSNTINGIVPSGTTYSWNAPVVTGGMTGGQPGSGQILITGTLNNPTDLVQTAVYTVRPITSSGCLGDSFRVTVRINPGPRLVLPADQHLCSAKDILTDSTLRVNISVPTQGATVSWTVNPPAGITGITPTSSNDTIIPRQFLVNTTANPIIVTYSIIPKINTQNNSGCTGSSIPYNIVVNPRPSISNIPVTICGDSSFKVTPSSTVSGNIIPSNTTYTWGMPVLSTPNSVTGMHTGTLQPYITDTLKNLTNTVQTVTYSLTPTSGLQDSCIGDSFKVIVTLNPKPIIDTIRLMLCSDSSFSITPTNGGGNIVPAGTIYSWGAPSQSTAGGVTITTGATGNSQLSISSTRLINNTDSVQILTYKVKPFNSALLGSCPGDSFIVIITVNPKPTIATILQTICSDSSFNIVPSNGGGNIIPQGTTYSWSTPVISPSSTGVTIVSGSTGTNAASISSDTLKNTTNVTQTVTYTVTPRVNISSCPGTPFTVAITVNPKPTINDRVDTVCTGTPFTYQPANTINGIVPSGTTYSWNAPVVTGGMTGGQPGSGQILITGTLNNPTDLVQTAVYTVRPITSSGCLGDSFKVTVRVNPAPRLVLPADQHLCSAKDVLTDSTLRVNISVPSQGATVSWTVNPPAGITGITPTSSNDTIIPRQFLVNTTANPIIVTYSIIPKINTQNNSGCTGSSIPYNIVVNPRPSISNIPVTICGDSSFKVTPSSTVSGNIIPGNTTYTWGMPVLSTPNSVTGMHTGTLQPYITDTLKNLTNSVQTITYTLVPTSGLQDSCVGDSFKVIVTLNPKPIIATIRQTICSDSSFNILPDSSLIGNIVPNGTRYSWSAPLYTGLVSGGSAGVRRLTIADTLYNNTDTVQTITYTVAPFGNPASCPGDSFKVIITLNPKPTIATIRQTICSDSSFNIVPSNGGVNIIPQGTTYSWPAPVITPSATGVTIVSGSTGINASLISSDTLKNITNVTQTVTYTVTPRAGLLDSCPGTPFNVIITVNPKPTINNRIDTICSGDDFVYNPNNTVNGIVPFGTTYTWSTPVLSCSVDSLKGGSAASGVSIISDTLTNYSVNPQTAVYTVVPISPSGCLGDPFIVTVTVNPSPSVIFTPGNQHICSGTNTQTVVLSSATPGVVILWNIMQPVPAGITGTINNGRDSIPTQLLVNNTSQPITIVDTARAFNVGTSGCPGAPFPYDIVVNPTPKIKNYADTICSRDSFYVHPLDNPSTQIVPAGTKYIWTVDPSPYILGDSDQTMPKDTIGATLVNTDTATHIAVYHVTPISGLGDSCRGPQFTITITVNPTPEIPALFDTICSHSTFAVTPLAALGTLYTWVNPPTITPAGTVVAYPSNNPLQPQTIPRAIISERLRNLTSMPADVLYKIKPISGVCGGGIFDVKVHINPSPEINDTTFRICTDSSFNIIRNDFSPNQIVPNGTVYTWVNPPVNIAAGTIIGGQAESTLQNSIFGGPLTNITPLTNTASDTNAVLIYTVTPQVTQVSGAMDIGQCFGDPFAVKVYVNPDAKATYSYTKDTACWQFALPITNTSYNTVNSNYYWYAVSYHSGSAVDSLIGTGYNFPGYTIQNPDDSIDIKLVAESRYGCVNDTIVHRFFTRHKQYPNFTITYSPASQCGPKNTVTFTNTTPFINSFQYSWNFGTAPNALTPPPSIATSTLAQPGSVDFYSDQLNYLDVTYPVTLTVFNECETTQVIYNVIISSKPKSKFVPDKPRPCSNSTITFTNTSMPNVPPDNSNTYIWVWDDGTPNDTTKTRIPAITHNYNTGVVDTFNTTLIAINNCGADTSVFPIIVSPITIQPAVQITPFSQIGCSPHQVEIINNTSGGQTYTWDFGDGTYTTTGVRTPDTIRHTYTQCGNYKISSRATNICSDTTTYVYATILCKPQPKFTAINSGDCVGHSISFANQTITSDPANTQYIWHFQDGTSTTGFSPTHIYNAPGVYRDTLVAILFDLASGVSCSDIYVGTVTIVDSVRGNITIIGSGNCTPSTVTFINNNRPSRTPATWDFGDGTPTVTGDSVTHTYTATGTYVIHMNSVEIGGCKNGYTDTVKVGGAAGQLIYLSNNVCLPYTGTKFEAITNAATDSIHWYFGDGKDTVTRNTSTNPSTIIYHQYLTPGAYTPYIDLYSGISCVIRINGTTPIRVDSVNAGFRYTDNMVCDSTEINFFDTSYAYSGIQHSIWSYGTGSINDTALVSSHYYTINNTYQVVHTVVSNLGCRDTSKQNIVIKLHETPNVQIQGPNPICIYTSGTYTAQTIFTTDSINYYNWTVTNPSGVIVVTSVDTFVNVRFSIVGTYNIRLIVGTVFGCYDTIYKTVTVNPSSININYTINNVGCTPHVVQIINNSTGANTYSWNFGDVAGPVPPTSANTIVSGPGQAVTHTYQNPGTYYITMLAQNGGCTDTTIIDSVKVLPTPSALFTFTASDNCVNHTIQFNNGTSIPAQYSWSFGDGGTSTLQNPSHLYSPAGTYTATLTSSISYSNGLTCSTSYSLPIRIVDTLQGNVTVSSRYGICKPFTVIFTNNIRPVQSISWNFGDGTPLGTSDVVTHTYTDTGTYYVNMIAIDPGGCKYKYTDTIIVGGAAGNMQYSSNVACLPYGSTRLEILSNAATDSIHWFFGDGDTAVTINGIGVTSTIINHHYNLPGVYNPRAVLYSQNGTCIVPIYGQTPVKVDSVHAGFSYTQNQLCDSTQYYYTDSSYAFSGLQTLAWDFGFGPTTTTGSPVYNNYTIGGNYNVIETVTSQWGCVDQDTVPINVVIHQTPSAQIVLNPLDSACSNDTIRLRSIINSVDAVLNSNINWTVQPPVGSPIIHTGANYDFVVTIPGKYYVYLSVTTIYGCSKTIKDSIIVYPYPSLVVGLNTKICLNQSVQLTASGASNYSWTPITTPNDLSCYTCQNPTASPRITTTYTVTSQEHGCSISKDITVKVIQPFTMIAPPNDTICIGQSSTLTANGAPNYLWTPGGFTTQSITVSPQVTTTYHLTGTDNDNCFRTDTNIVVAVGQYPVITMGRDTILSTGTLFPLNSSITNGPIRYYTWSPSYDLDSPYSPRPIATVKNNVCYTLVAENIYGCADTGKICIKVFCEDSQVFIPNAFTPDDASRGNNILMVRATGIKSVKQFTIFNRWGQIVFEKQNFRPNDPSAGWDGKIKGIPAASGVFVYIAEVVCENDVHYMYKGNVTLLK